MKDENIGLAILLAKKAGIYGVQRLSTSSLSALMDFSQQSISRKLRELESEGVISRKSSTSGIDVSFTDKGRKELESLYLELNSVFSKKEKAVLQGKVIDGLGE